jgi:F-type H+-transporting ATPase subunit b
MTRGCQQQIAKIVGRLGMLQHLNAVSVVLFTLFIAVLSARAEEGGSATQQSAENLFKWINFAIVAGVIVWLCVKKAPAYFGRRADQINSSIKNSTDAKELADQHLRDAEAKLRNLEKEIGELRASGQRESAAEAERIRNLTQTDAQKIDAAAKAEVQASERAARMELKALAANLAVNGAESLLAKQLTPAAQESLINNFVKSLDGRPN